MRSRRRVLPVVLMAATIAVAGGCAHSNTPKGYDEVTRTNFLQGCTGGGTNSPGSSESTCRCVYDWVVVNVPFDSKTGASVGGYTGPNFVDLDEQLKKDPTNFPGELSSALSEACPGWGSPSGSSGDAGTTDTGVSPGTSIVTDTTTSS